MERIDVDSMFFGMLDFVTERSTCERAHVGAMLVLDRRPISMGYNGAPPGMPECIEEGVGCEENWVEAGGTMQLADGCARTVHAEANAIAFAARNGIPTVGTTMYCTYAPCYDCAKLMLSAGVVGLKYKKEYRDERGKNLLALAGVTVTKYV